MFYWVLKYVVLGPILNLLFPTKVEGSENLPESGAAILASNHLSYSDWLFLPLQSPRRITFLAKATAGSIAARPALRAWRSRPVAR